MTVLLDTAPGLSTRRASCAFAMATRCGADCCPQGKEPVLPGCGPLTWAMALCGSLNPSIPSRSLRSPKRRHTKNCELRHCASASKRVSVAACAHTSRSSASHLGRLGSGRGQRGRKCSAVSVPPVLQCGQITASGSSSCTCAARSAARGYQPSRSWMHTRRAFWLCPNVRMREHLPLTAWTSDTTSHFWNLVGI